MDLLFQALVIKVEMASIKGIKINQSAVTGAKLYLVSFCVKNTNIQAERKPSHIEPESPKNILKFLPNKPKLKIKNMTRQDDPRKSKPSSSLIRDI